MELQPMALPKRRQSKARTRKRRSHHALRRPGTTLCPRCNAVNEPHRICHNCGYYANRAVVAEKK
ncbi:MAG: 50S ribosomal protein L32 [Alphaproteobacteria bacterium]